ncbi:hypothetical protein Ae168Ps1_3509c [Pseudonocardia sp. Ae168_Ps1]|nr:hypothetical protein Ae150APs1_3486c [Pseudonocardia sp. Ae150A_Ps1]OLL81103.1 hypothetical protein Ae168Ps1_3509c [Pseudonocardia sp. Ae168_Ps1]OLL84783.1 hypothetical protein Ae263Ps1_1838 [Pseudonocardia sp. Ae263_Ps1]OLL95200.1 hypothetical protein Ae356Ps1_5097c [Pseudonocardia sp. Ae356_Ps1]
MTRTRTSCSSGPVLVETMGSVAGPGERQVGDTGG